MTEIFLDDQEDALRFFAAIRKESVCSDSLGQFAADETGRRKRLAEEQELRSQQEGRRRLVACIWKEESQQEQSLLIRAIVSHLNGRPGLEMVTPPEVLEAIGYRKEPPYEPPLPPQPPGAEKVLVIAARHAWPEYGSVSAYLCQPNRTFRDTSHIAFYAEGSIRERVPRILEVVDEVVLSSQGVNEVPGLTQETRRRLNELIDLLPRTCAARHLGKKRKILFLSGPEFPETIKLQRPVLNDLANKAGRTFAFTQGQRYVDLSRLSASPGKTSELC